MTFLGCNGLEDRLIDCPFPGWGIDNGWCSRYDNAGVRCYKTDPVNATMDTLRLADATETDATITGRLEVFVDGEWGTVCDDSFGWRDAQVACRGLGYHPLGKFFKKTPSPMVAANPPKLDCLTFSLISQELPRLPVVALTVNAPLAQDQST